MSEIAAQEPRLWDPTTRSVRRPRNIRSSFPHALISHCALQSCFRLPAEVVGDMRLARAPIWFHSNNLKSCMQSTDPPSLRFQCEEVITCRRAAMPAVLVASLIPVLAAGCGGGGGYGGGGGNSPQPSLAPCTSLATNLKLDGGANPPGCGSGNCSTGFAFQLLVLDNSNVYCFEYDATNGAATGGSIRTVPKAGGSVTTVVSGLRGVNNFVVDDSNV